MPSKFPTLVSFYTNTWQYKQHAERLKKECEYFNIPYIIEELEDSGSWMDNTRLKPKFIHDILKRVKGPIIWIDVDASIKKSLTELSGNIPWDFMSVHQRTGLMRNWHVGVMFFNYNDRTIKLVENWYKASKTGTDEANFETTWNQYKDILKISFKELPKSYYVIPESGYNIKEIPTITHGLSKCPTKIRKK